MNLRLNEYSESIKLLIHKDSRCLSSNMHTIHPKCDDSNFSIQFGADRVESMHIGTQRLALFPNESAVQTNQLNQWFNDKISNLPPPNGSLSLIFKVQFSII